MLLRLRITLFILQFSLENVRKEYIHFFHIKLLIVR